MNRNNRREMKWLMLMCALVSLVPLALPGCAKAPPPVEKPIVIGGSLPLTGIYADTGKVIKEGYDKWAEDINAKGGLLGRPVELRIYDDTSSVEKAVTLLEKVITVDKVDLLLGGYPGTTCSAQMPIAEKYKMVYCSMGGHMHSFIQGYTYSFGPPPLMGEWWYEGFFDWLETLPEKDRPKIAASFTMNNPVGISLLDSIKRGCERCGINLAINERYDLPLASAEPLVAKAKAANADIFLSNGFFDDGVLTIRACKALGYNPAFYLQGIGNIIPAWVEELGSDGNYVFSGTVMHNKLPYPGVKELNEWYMKQRGILAPTYFLFGYGWMQALEQGVEGAGSLDNTAIRDWLRTHEISTVGGKFTFDEKGLPPPFSIATQILNGEVELIWPLEVRTAEPVYPKPAWGK